MGTASPVAVLRAATSGLVATSASTRHRHAYSLLRTTAPNSRSPRGAALLRNTKKTSIMAGHGADLKNEDTPDGPSSPFDAAEFEAERLARDSQAMAAMEVAATAAMAAGEGEAAEQVRKMRTS